VVGDAPSFITIIIYYYYYFCTSKKGNISFIVLSASHRDVKAPPVFAIFPSLSFVLCSPVILELIIIKLNALDLMLHQQHSCSNISLSCIKIILLTPNAMRLIVKML